jgi:hypothetical protein
LSRRKDATATVKQSEVDSCISRGYRGAELKDTVGLACFAVGRPKKKAVAVLLTNGGKVLPLHLQDERHTKSFNHQKAKNIQHQGFAGHHRPNY